MIWIQYVCKRTVFFKKEEKESVFQNICVEGA